MNGMKHRIPKCEPLDLARVLIVNDDPTSRLTLQTLLQAGGYHVDFATTAAEAVGKLDGGVYQLVLSDLEMESPRAGLRVLAHAKLMEYQPATAIITTYQNSDASGMALNEVFVQPQDIPGLLSKVANLIAHRVNRVMRRQLRNSRN